METRSVWGQPMAAGEGELPVLQGHQVMITC